ncbi:MAG: hypothetical protein ACFFF9_09525 [Candidatus Thorarchaeota archaeon]
MTGEGSAISGSENEGPLMVGAGFFLLMISLACSIGIGTSALITSPYVSASLVSASYFLGLLFSAPLGGYLFGKGFLLILRKSRS